MRTSRLGVLLLVIVVAVSCGKPSSPEPAPTPTPVFIRVVVDTSKSSCVKDLAAKPGTCYLPIYTRPTFEAPSEPVNSAPESKCTPKNERRCWPQPDTELRAVCKLEGTHIQDSMGRGSAAWYGVVIPQGELLVDRTLLPSTLEDEVVGFASEVWLRKLDQQELPSCEGVIAYG